MTDLTAEVKRMLGEQAFAICVLKAQLAAEKAKQAPAPVPLRDVKTGEGSA